jgi:hypothetical protein
VRRRRKRTPQGQCGAEEEDDIERDLKLFGINTRVFLQNYQCDICFVPEGVY